MRILISSLFLLFLGLSLSAQQTSRSGFPAEPENKDRFRRFPCGGNVILDEKFSGGLPDGWQTLDVDQLLPRDEITFLTPNPGWQGVVDFKDNLKQNKILASPSWYKDTVGTSDDFLILPQMVLPENTCISWYAYSQDTQFGESYEIRVSTTTPDAAGFLANPPVYTVEDQGSDFTFESTSLAAYGGQNVYVAFRHTSTNKFILAIDDVLMAQVQNFDIAMFEVNSINANPGDSVFIKGSVINKGLVPYVFDSLEMNIHLAVDNQELFSFGIPDSFELLPNDTVQFQATQAWVPEAEESVPLSVWVSGFGVDDAVSNDTISRFQPIGNTVSIDPEEFLGELSIYPNPVNDLLVLKVNEVENISVRIYDLQGKEVLDNISTKKLRDDTWALHVQALNPGLYILYVEDSDGKRSAKKFIKQ